MAVLILIFDLMIRIIGKFSLKTNILLEKIRNKKPIKNDIKDKYLLRRFEDLVNASSKK